jgi:hypothetical protein
MSTMTSIPRHIARKSTVSRPVPFEYRIPSMNSATTNLRLTNQYESVLNECHVQTEKACHQTVHTMIILPDNEIELIENVNQEIFDDVLKEMVDQVDEDIRKKDQLNILCDSGK